jgi:hypothetical protein
MFNECCMILLTLFVRWNAANKIGDEGAIRIAEGLERNTSLKELLLGGVFHPCCCSFIASQRLVFDINDKLCISHFCHYYGMYEWQGVELELVETRE